MCSLKKGRIGVFDSGYGGLTILQQFRKVMPDYDFVYLGDNARTPYGSRSFDIVYEYTRQSVRKLYDMGCPLIILACNTASAKALRSIQKIDIPMWDSSLRVLGVIRPTVEAICSMTRNKHVGLLATEGTVQSESYPIELAKMDTEIRVSAVACPMWVPLVENQEYESDGADYFVEKYVAELMKKDADIDTVILGCTHYPLLLPKIKKYFDPNIRVVTQGEIVALSLKDYLARHPEIDNRLSKGGRCDFFTTESTEKFRKQASVFLKEKISVCSISID